MTIAYIYQPTPPAQRLFEKSETYRVFYTDTYKLKARKVQFTYAALGLAILAGVYVIVIIYAIITVTDTYRLQRMIGG